MKDAEKRLLVIEHAKLTAAHASGNNEVKQRMEEIEARLQLSAVEIAMLAINTYMKDY